MYIGKFKAIAVSNADPENRGRIRVTCPHIYGDYESPWCEPCTPYADLNEGFFFIPSVGQGVWIECEEGDYDRPIWVGMWWAENEVVDFRDKSQQIIAGKSEIIIKVGSGQLSIKNGSITVSGEANVTINASTKITLAGDVDITGDLKVNKGVDVKEDITTEAGITAADDISTTGDIKAGLFTLKTHKHIGGTLPPGMTGTPGII